MKTKTSVRIPVTITFSTETAFSVRPVSHTITAGRKAYVKDSYDYDFPLAWGSGAEEQFAGSLTLTLNRMVL